MGDLYAMHLASSAWRIFRQLVLARDKDRCVLCNSDECLEVHHRTYERLGKEDVADCYALCHLCHAMVTDAQRRKRYVERQLPSLGDVVQTAPIGDSYQWTSNSQEDNLYETNTQVSSVGCLPALDAQWSTCRPLKRLGESDQTNLRQTYKDRGRPGRDGTT